MDEKILLKPIRKSPAGLAQELQDCILLLRRKGISDSAKRHLCRRIEQIEIELGIRDGKRKDKIDSNARRSHDDLGRSVGRRPK